jgi:hypothetical protein
MHQHVCYPCWICLHKSLFRFEGRIRGVSSCAYLPTLTPVSSSKVSSRVCSRTCLFTSLRRAYPTRAAHISSSATPQQRSDLRNLKRKYERQKWSKQSMVTMRLRWTGTDREWTHAREILLPRKVFGGVSLPLSERTKRRSELGEGHKSFWLYKATIKSKRTKSWKWFR